MNGSAARPAYRSRSVRHSRAVGPQLRVTENISGARHVIVATGPIDIAGTTTLIAALGGAIAPRRRVLVDLTSVTFLAEAGLAVLLDAHSQLAVHGGELTLTGVSRRIRRLLQITGSDRLLQLELASRAASNTAVPPVSEGIHTVSASKVGARQ